MGLDRDNVIFRIARAVPILSRLDIANELKAILVGENKDMQKEHMRVLRENVHPGMVVVDVGAHKGLHTLYMERLGGFVHAFEPGLVFTKLSKRTRWKNVTCYNYALGESSGFVQFYEYHKYKSSISGLKPNSGESHANMVRAVPVARLDDFGLEPSFMKIDVEGHEEEVLRGAMATITKMRPVIFLEVWPWASKDFLKMMFELGYTSTEIDHTNVLLKP